MTDFIDYLKTQYHHKTDASASFKNSFHILHVEAPEIRKAFDTVPPGIVSSTLDIVLQGTLHYNDLDGSYRYSFSKILNKEGETCIRIQFFRNESTHSNAEFISVPCTSQSISVTGAPGTGNWHDATPTPAPTTPASAPSDQFNQLKKKYTHHSVAFALFFKNVEEAVRVEIPAIGKEFTDGAYIGKDPEGFLYYNYLSDLTGNVKYTVSKVTNSDNKVCARVQFYRKTSTNCHAEFLAEDPTGTVAAAGLDGFSASGDWKDLNIGSATASVTKHSDSNTIEVKVGSIHKQATMSDADALKGKVVDKKGTLYYKDIKNLDGKYASYNDDRIVFYADNNYGKDFYAYFVPYESDNTLGVKSADTKIFENVGWKTTK